MKTQVANAETKTVSVKKKAVNVENNKWDRRPILLAFAALCSLSIFVCLFLYQADNKYTVEGPRGQNGLLLLDEQTLEKHPVIFLVDGWNYYSGQLLTPADLSLNTITPDASLYIGQYGGFDMGNVSDSPHGNASYRLIIELPPEPRRYMLELPEIFSSYKAYINGQLVRQMGNPDPALYLPETGNRTVVFEVGGQADILIAVSDFSHMYSGMVYPPAFGEPDALSSLLSARLVFRCIFVAFALAVGLFALIIGFASQNNRLAVLYGLLCLFFVGYTSYPIVKKFFTGFYPFYTIEHVSFCAMLVTVMLLQKTVCGQEQRLSRIFAGFGFVMCFFSAVLPFLLTSGSIMIMVAYSYSIMAYEWLTAVYITFYAIKALLSDRVHSKILLGGILIFDITLIMDRLLPLYEPIITGWFYELSSAALVFAVGVAVLADMVENYQLSAVLAERTNSMERLSEIQKTSHDLIQTQIKEVKTLHHDVRHHFIMIEGFLQSGEYDQAHRYIKELQVFFQGTQPLCYSQNFVVNVLVHYYVQLAETNQIELMPNLGIDRETGVLESDLCSVLSNLLENGLEACKRQQSGKRLITLSMIQKPSALFIRMENSVGDIPSEQRGIFASSKSAGRKGYGLDSIRMVVKRYSGEAEFKYDQEATTFISTVLLTF